MEALQGGGQITPITTIKRHRAAAGRVRHRPRSLKTAGGRSPLIIKDLDLYPQPPTNTRSPTLNSEEPLYPTTRPRGDRGLRRSRGFLLRQRRRRSPQQVLQTRTRMVRRPLEGTRRPRQPRPPDGWTGTTAPASPTTTTSTVLTFSETVLRSNFRSQLSATLAYPCVHLVRLWVSLIAWTLQESLSIVRETLIGAYWKTLLAL